MSNVTEELNCPSYWMAINFNIGIHIHTFVLCT